jgi:uracil phosphoribosyltransferase
LVSFVFADTGNTVVKAVNVLMEHEVSEENIILLNLFCTPQGW